MIKKSIIFTLLMATSLSRIQASAPVPTPAPSTTTINNHYHGSNGASASQGFIAGALAGVAAHPMIAGMSAVGALTAAGAWFAYRVNKRLKRIEAAQDAHRRENREAFTKIQATLADHTRAHTAHSSDLRTLKETQAAHTLSHTSHADALKRVEAEQTAHKNRFLDFSASMMHRQTELDKLVKENHAVTQARFSGLEQSQAELKSGQADIVDIVSRTHTMKTGEVVPPMVQGRRNWGPMIVPHIQSFSQVQAIQQTRTITMSQTSQPVFGTSSSSETASAQAPRNSLAALPTTSPRSSVARSVSRSSSAADSLDHHAQLYN